MQATEYSYFDETAANYDLLDSLENYREKNGQFTFKLSWPVFAGGPPSQGRSNLKQVWRQTSNPLNETIAGYEELSVECTDHGWGGLEMFRLRWH